jgi:hypothetical protein
MNLKSLRSVGASRLVSLFGKCLETEAKEAPQERSLAR